MEEIFKERDEYFQKLWVKIENKEELTEVEKIQLKIEKFRMMTGMLDDYEFGIDIRQRVNLEAYLLNLKGMSVRTLAEKYPELYGSHKNAVAKNIEKGRQLYFSVCVFCDLIRDAKDKCKPQDKKEYPTHLNKITKIQWKSIEEDCEE